MTLLDISGLPDAELYELAATAAAGLALADLVQLRPLVDRPAVAPVEIDRANCHRLLAIARGRGITVAHHDAVIGALQLIDELLTNNHVQQEAHAA